MIVNVDAAALEWRVAVVLSMDEVGIAEINNTDAIEDEEEKKTKDTHSLNVAEFRLPERRTAKFFLFRVIFRGTGWAFAHDNMFTHVSTNPQWWDERIAMFFKKYNGLDRKHKEWADLVTKRKNIVGPTGREWFVPMKVKRDVFDNILSVDIPWSDLSNYPVQGTGADIVAIARVSLRNRLRKYRMHDVKLITTVHDSIKADVPDKQAKDVASMMYEVFDDLPLNFKKLFKVELPIAFPGEVQIGPNFHDMQVVLKRDL